MEAFPYSRTEFAKLMKVFVPFSEDLIARYGLGLGDLVPFDLQYECLRLRESDPKQRPAGREQEAQSAACGKPIDFTALDFEVEILA